MPRGVVLAEIEVYRKELYVRSLFSGPRYRSALLTIFAVELEFAGKS